MQVPAELHEEFEPLFRTNSIDAVRNSDGFLSVTIGKPTETAPNEYLMISKWRDQSSLIAFAGQNWNEAHIPAGMEKYVEQCWVNHYETFE